MNIQEFYDSIDENYENVSNRMMGNQKLVEKFVRKFLDDPTYEQIKEAVNKMDYDEILRTTHTMKGIASNLEFTRLQQKSAKAVDMIRAGQREEVLPVISEIEKEYQKVIEQITKLAYRIHKHKRVFFDFERGPFYSCSFLDDMI